MDKYLLKAVTAAAVALFMTGCSDAPKPADTNSAEAKKAPEKAPEPVAGQTAFYEMYKPARQWAADLLPLTLVSNDVPGKKVTDGKAWMWTAVFVSPSRREARTLFYSVVEHDQVLRGVTVGGAQAWTGATTKSKPFSNTEFQVNSDAAYKTIFAKADTWVNAHPDKKLQMFLTSAQTGAGAVWTFMWGDTKSGYVGRVNATTGAAVQ